MYGLYFGPFCHNTDREGVAFKRNEQKRRIISIKAISNVLATELVTDFIVATERKVLFAGLINNIDGLSILSSPEPSYPLFAAWHCLRSRSNPFPHTKRAPRDGPFLA